MLFSIDSEQRQKKLMSTVVFFLFQHKEQKNNVMLTVLRQLKNDEKNKSCNREQVSC